MEAMAGWRHSQVREDHISGPPLSTPACKSREQEQHPRGLAGKEGPHLLWQGATQGWAAFGHTKWSWTDYAQNGRHSKNRETVSPFQKALSI